jgi:hypothetical protein
MAKGNTPHKLEPDSGQDSTRERWQRDYQTQLSAKTPVVNRSGIRINSLYDETAWICTLYAEQLG